MRKTRSGLAVMLAMAVLACSDAPSAPAATVAPCATSLGSEPGFDLVLDGNAGCPGTIRMSLRVATGSPSAPAWTPADQGPVRVEGAWTPRATGAARSVVVHNVSAAPVDLVGLEWAADGLPGSLDRMLHVGYQSWSYAGIEAIPASIPEHAGTVAHGGDDEDVTGEVPGVSFWVSALADAQGRGLVAGADGATVLKSYVAADGKRLRIVEGATDDVLHLAPGETRALDGLFFDRGDVRGGLDAYGAHVAAAHGRPRQKALGGWGSWNLYYETITADLLRAEAAWAADHLVPRGLDTFLTDDGYEPHWGAWSAKPAFGAALDAFASEQQARGLVPAIWLAPVYVDTTDPVFAANPDWFVGKLDGSGPRTFVQFDNTVKAPLDVTHPVARAFAVNQLRTLWNTGYRVFKLDFLFGAGIAGRRQESVTGLESYARWMSAIRTAVPDAHLVGCGAPLLPSVGTFDSMRTGADIAFAPSPEPFYPYLAFEARETAMRAFTDAWWAMDPDVVLLRGARIGDAEAFTAIVSAALAGGNYLLGDGRQAGDLRAGMALDPEILAMTRDGRAARADDLTAEIDPHIVSTPVLGGQGDTAIPHVWKKASADGARHWMAVFAWLVDPFEIDLDIPAGAVEIAPPSAPGPMTTRLAPPGRQHLSVPARSVRLFRY